MSLMDILNDSERKRYGHSYMMITSMDKTLRDISILLTADGGVLGVTSGFPKKISFGNSRC